MSEEFCSSSSATCCLSGIGFTDVEGRIGVRSISRTFRHGPAFPLLPLEEEGRLVADAGKRDWDKLATEYGDILMEGLVVLGTRGKHVNVLQYLMGYLKNHLSSEEKQELLDLIEDYRQGLVPLIVPLTLLKHHLNRNPGPEWVHQQVYLHPYSKELMLRSHV